MSDEPKKRRWWSRAGIWWAFVLLVALYPLSEGPALWFSVHYDITGWPLDALFALYGPLHWCVAQSEVTDHAHDSYILFWFPWEP